TFTKSWAAWFSASMCWNTWLQTRPTWFIDRSSAVACALVVPPHAASAASVTSPRASPATAPRASARVWKPPRPLQGDVAVRPARGRRRRQGLGQPPPRVGRLDDVVDDADLQRAVHATGHPGLLLDQRRAY